MCFQFPVSITQVFSTVLMVFYSLNTPEHNSLLRLCKSAMEKKAGNNCFLLCILNMKCIKLTHNEEAVCLSVCLSVRSSPRLISENLRRTSKKYDIKTSTKCYPSNFVLIHIDPLKLVAVIKFNFHLWVYQMWLILQNISTYYEIQT